MKILVLQLARFGDIFMTSPVLKALRRQNPNAQIDLIVRSRFHEAAHQIEGFDNLHQLSTTHLLEPILQPNMNEDGSFERANELIAQLKEQNYDQVINLSFSPASSWLTHIISGPETVIKGYSRFSDGSFRICDEASEYFYAQVGVGQNNRFHLINMMGAVAGADVLAEDMQLSKIPLSRITCPPKAIAMHIGASQDGKRISVIKWSNLIRELGDANGETPIILLGSESERADGEKIASSTTHPHVYNFVGKTKWSDALNIVAKACLLVAGDSSMIQVANLTGTPCFNITNPTVNFWETGPRSANSFVYYESEFEMLNTKDVAQQIQEVLAGWTPDTLFRSVDELPAFIGPALGTEFQWALIGALYWGLDFPKVPKQHIEALNHLRSLNEVVIENLQKADKIDPDILGQILRRADEIQDLISNQFPELRPMFKFFEVERVRIAPGTRADIIKGMITCHDRFGVVLDTFLAFQQPTVEMADGQL